MGVGTRRRDAVTAPLPAVHSVRRPVGRLTDAKTALLTTPKSVPLPDVRGRTGP